MLDSSKASALALCNSPEIAGWTEEIQKTLFRVGGSLATAPEAQKGKPLMLPEDEYSALRRLTVIACPADQAITA